MTDPPTDHELFTRWQAGDQAAGGALIKRHFASLHRFFSTKAHGHEEDLIQTTFVACVEARDAFRGEATFRTYLFKLARFQLYTYYRKAARSQQLDFTSSSVRDLATSPSGALMRHEERELLKHALQLIPVDQQIALELTYWEELSAPEVAEVLGIPENTVYSRLRRAKVHVREALAQLTDAPDERRRALALLDAHDDDEAGEPA